MSDYVVDLQRATLQQRSGKKRLILSGAFADCEPDFQQNMMQAVHAFTEAALKSGMGLSFGAHPTFQFMIFDLARRLRTTDYLVALHMYVSLYFVTASTVAEFQKSARVFPIQAVTGDRAASLTLMRKAMINDPEAVGLVVIGGKTARAGHTPGIDEEVALAREAGLPVFIVGSVGGRSSEICVSKSLGELDSFNRLSAEDKKQLLEGLDYSSIARAVLDSLEK